MTTFEDPGPGDVIDGRYLLERVIGRGGHGVVYAATDQQTGMGVALKPSARTSPRIPSSPCASSARPTSLRALWDESVVRVHAFGNDAEGSVFMVMELLEGETLDDHLYDLEDFGDRMSAFEVLRCLDPVARAPHRAHQGHHSPRREAREHLPASPPRPAAASASWTSAW